MWKFFMAMQFYSDEFSLFHSFMSLAPENDNGKQGSQSWSRNTAKGRLGQTRMNIFVGQDFNWVLF